MSVAPENPLLRVDCDGLLDLEMPHGPLLLEWGLTPEDVERMRYRRTAAGGPGVDGDDGVAGQDDAPW